MGSAVYTVPAPGGGGWWNELDGDDRLLGVYPTKDAAEWAGREEARRRQIGHVVYERDGTIAGRAEYGRSWRQ